MADIQNPKQEDHLRFDIAVRLPKAAPLKIKDFETNLPVFEHTVGDLGAVLFDKASLKGSSTPIAVKSIAAGSALSLETSAAKITADKIALHNAGKGKAATQLSVTTSSACVRGPSPSLVVRMC